MLAECGVTWVVIGHSERRHLFGELDYRVNEKARAALAHGITPIVAVGETAEEHAAGQARDKVCAQVHAAFDGLPLADLARCVVAYEPIWAIGTGNADSPASANAIMGEIRALAGLDHARILYGGSMKPDNVAEFLAQPNIDGGLVGGASLDPGSFAALLEGARAMKKRPFVLAILDGWGTSASAHGNAILAADLPNWTRILATYPHTLLEASGEAVGLPKGVMGNSEVGHINIGSGRVVPQGVVVIDEEIASGTFGQNKTLRACIDHVRKTGGTLHLLGLISDGKVHSSLDHVEALIDVITEAAVPLAIDAFLDGRDTPPRSAGTYLARLEQHLAKHHSTARSRRSRAATTRWTATSAGTARARPTTRSRTHRRVSVSDRAGRARRRIRARRERRVRRAGDRRRAAPDPRRRRVHLLQLPSRPRAPAHARVQRSGVLALPGAHVRRPRVRDDDALRGELPQPGPVRAAAAVPRVRRDRRERRS